MRILYLGDKSGTSHQRTGALTRLGHQVRVIDPMTFLPQSGLMGRWVYKTGGLFVTGTIEKKVIRLTADERYDLVWVDSGVMISRRLVEILGARNGRVVNYNIDDPYGPRDGWRWRNYLSAVPAYDLVVVMRDHNIAEALQAGAKKVLRVFMSADEVDHAPRPITVPDQEKWAAEVAFIGTWMPGRGRFLEELARHQVPLSIHGDRWHRAPEWKRLQRFWRGPNLSNSDDYVKAIQYAKICLGLLSKGNRDLHTTRSIEIPHIGSLLLAERTTEHQALYRENEEAVFWADASECAAQCRRLLADDRARAEIAQRGQQRSIANGILNEVILRRIIDNIP